MSQPTGNPRVDELLQEYDDRLRDDDTRHDAAGKEWLRQMRPAIFILAQTEPERFEQALTRALKEMSHVHR